MKSNLSRVARNIPHVLSILVLGIVAVYSTPASSDITDVFPTQEDAEIHAQLLAQVYCSCIFVSQQPPDHCKTIAHRPYPEFLSGAASILRALDTIKIEQEDAQTIRAKFSFLHLRGVARSRFVSPRYGCEIQ